MKKHLSLVKSILILMLALIALYQVSELWLVALTNRNFFLYIEARFPAAVPDGQSAWILPYRLFFGTGCGRYRVRYSGIENSHEWVFGSFAVSQILSGGVYAGEVSHHGLMDISGGRPLLVYEYSFPMHGETFARALGGRRGGFPSGSPVTTFTSVTLLPPAGGMDEPLICAFFWNGSVFSHFTLSLDTRRFDLYDFLFEAVEIEEGELYFTRSETGFSPVLPEGFAFAAVYVENPFHNAFGLLHLSTIRPRIEHFFDNPATILPGPSRDVYTFSNINVMVRYLLFDVLEYTSFRPIGRTAPANLVSDFSAALAFVQSDPYVINEIYLVGYEVRGGNHVFSFGYVLDNFPIVLDVARLTMPDCREPLASPIEVTVSHGRVVRYRRLAQTFHTSDRLVYFEGDVSGHSTLGFVFDESNEVHFSGIR